MKKSARILALALSLLLLLLPMAAQARSEDAAPLPPTDHLNMATFSFDSITHTANGQTTDIPASFELSMGMDVARKRGAALIRLLYEDLNVSAMASAESGEVRAQIGDMKTGVRMPLTEFEDMLIQNNLLWGLTYDQIGEDTREALTAYLDLMEQSMLEPAAAASIRDILDIMYPADQWKEDYDQYPSLLNAQYQGEEEITLFGETYTAKKYTYLLDHATEEEYDVFYEAFDKHYEVNTPEQEAYSALLELVGRDYDAVYGDLYEWDEWNDATVWTDDGTLGGGESGSLSEWNEFSEDEYRYTLSGTIWQVDEVQGTYEESTITTHAPNGDYSTTCTSADLRTDTSARFETTEASLPSPDLGSAETTQSYFLSVPEEGDIRIDLYLNSSYVFTDGFETSSSMDMSMVIAEEQVSCDAEIIERYDEEARRMTMKAALDVGLEEGTDLLTSLTGPITIEADGETVTANVAFRMGTLPEGELLPPPAQAINPLTDEEAMDIFTKELYTWFMQLIGELTPAPETPSSVGGALFS